jgi:hypothetical protein
VPTKIIVGEPVARKAHKLILGSRLVVVVVVVVVVGVVVARDMSAAARPLVADFRPSYIISIEAIINCHPSRTALVWMNIRWK